MGLDKKTFRVFIFWSTILVGMTLPIVTLVAVNMMQNTKAINMILNDIITYYFRDYTDLGFLFWFFQSLVFIALAFLIKSKMEGKTGNAEPSVVEYSEAIGSWSLMVIFSVIVNIDVLISTSSTAAIAYIFIPFYEVVMILFGYALGWAIGKTIFRYRKNNGANEANEGRP